MQPTFNPDSSGLKQDVVLVNKFLPHRSTDLRRGDIITFRHPQNPKTLLTKRILGLEGDLIRLNRFNRSATPTRLIRIPMGHCWVEGDDGFHSKDSHDFGPIPIGLVDAKVSLIVWPISRFGPPSRRSTLDHHHDQLGSRNLIAKN